MKKLRDTLAAHLWNIDQECGVVYHSGSGMMQTILTIKYKLEVSLDKKINLVYIRIMDSLIKELDKK